MSEVLNKSKECILENAQFSWVLHVDGLGIAFQGGYAANYFKEHYTKLGYFVKEIKTYKMAGEIADRGER